MAQELTRDGFIALLVEQLKVNESMNGNVTNSDKEQIAQKCFRELCFDFPQVKSEQINALISTLTISIENGLEFHNWFWFAPKFEEGILYLMSHVNRADVDSELVNSLSHLAFIYFLRIAESIFTRNLNENELGKLGKNPNQDTSSDFENTIVRYFRAGCNYELYRHLSVSQWESFHVSATIFRVAKYMSGDDAKRSLNLQAKNASIIFTALRGMWAGYPFLLRDRIIDKPESICHILSAISDICEPGLVRAPTESVTLRKSILLSCTGAICTAVSDASIKDRYFLWEYIRDSIFPYILEQFSLNSSSNVPGFNETVKSCTIICEFFGRGNPKLGKSHQMATQNLLTNGTIRSVVQQYVKTSSCDSETYDAQISRAYLELLFHCCCRNENCFDFCTKVPGFLKNVLDHSASCGDDTRMCWMMLLLSSKQTCKDVDRATTMSEYEAILSDLHVVFDRPHLKRIIDLLQMIYENKFLLERLVLWSDNATFVKEVTLMEQKLKQTCMDNENEQEDVDVDIGRIDACVHARNLCKDITCAFRGAASKRD